MPSAFGKPVTTANRFGAVATPSSWTLVTTLTASNSAYLRYTGFSSASYKNYALLFSGWRAASAGGAPIYAYYSTDGGASFPGGATSYDYIWSFGGGNIVYHSFNDVQNFAYISDNISDDAKTSGGGMLYLTYGVVASARMQLNGTFGGYQSSNARQNITISASNYNSATEVNTIQFQFSGGNITNGTIKIYGIT